jgi:pimeloyl-ACP methyl ester carboxylesterase
MIASLATTAPIQFLDIGGTGFAYRCFGTPAGTPLVFTQHFMGNLDPAISGALAAGREIILFDNAGVGRSTGTAPHTIAGMAADAARFIDGLGHLYQRLPDAELMLLPDSGHGAHFQYVERFVRRVIDFLDVPPHDTATPA